MSKKFASILLIIVTTVGSFFTFYGANLLFSDVGNMGMGIKDPNIISSFPMIMIFCQFILGEIYLVRYIKRPQYVKAMSKKYLIIFACFSLVGLITAIVSGIIIYHSFFKPFPIPAYCFVMIVTHTLFIAAAIYFYILVNKRMKDDEEKREFSVLYVLKTIGFSLFVFFAFERFGAFLYSPFFIEWRTFYLSWPFIITLLVPMSMFIQCFLNNYAKYREKPLCGLFFAIINMVLGISCNVAVMIIGYSDSRLVSAISPAMALERLQCSRIDIVIITVLTVIVGAYALQYSLRMYLKSKKNGTPNIEENK